MKQKRKRDKVINFFKTNKFYLLIFLALFLICYFFPYTGDDWAWGTSIGLDRLKSCFKDYNGRWLGNLMVLLLTRVRILRAFIVSISISLIAILVSKIITKDEKKHRNNTLIVILLLLIIPSSIFQQSIAWTSGFCNYVLPVLFVLLYLYIVKTGNENLKTAIFSFFLGISSTLYIEHMTIYSVVLSIIICIADIVKNKKVGRNNLLYFIGSILGSTIMFSNGASINILNQTDSYRSVATSSNIFIRLFHSYFDTISGLLFGENFIINIVISILMILLIKKSNIKNNLIKNILILFYITLISYLIFNTIYVNLFSSLYLNGIICFLFFAITFVSIVLCLKKYKKMKKFIFCLISILLITLPLFFVTPVGPRCFFPTYVMFVSFALSIIDYLNIKFDYQIIKFIITVLIIFYFVLFFKVYKVDRVRTKYVNDNEVEKYILPKLPYDSYIWGGNPTDDVFQKRFKLFYNIDEYKSIEFIDYNLWVK